MSRIGKLPIEIPAGTEVKLEGNVITVKGKLGELTRTIDNHVHVKVEEKEIIVTVDEGHGNLHGLFRTLIANMVHGVSQGFEKKLEIIGVGYRAQVKGKTLGLTLGYSHPIDLPLPEGITVEQDEKNKNILAVKGIDKQLVGDIAAKIRSFRKPEPYKGKGIRYVGEYVRRKAGKSAAKAA